MQHIAIMRKSWGLTKKILSEDKKIESRWYQKRFAPWNKIKPGETVFFKDSGGPIVAKAEASKIEQFEDLNPLKVERILRQHYRAIGIERHKLEDYIERFKDKRYCVLTYLRNPVAVKPFYINKKGFAASSAWLCLDNINEIRMTA